MFCQHLFTDGETEQKLREEFAKTCFETLLQFSLFDGLDSDEVRGLEGGLAGRLAVTALLHRFQEVLHQYVEDERRSGKCPLPRYFLLKFSMINKFALSYACITLPILKQIHLKVADWHM
jgi:hypothetical protein